MIDLCVVNYNTKDKLSRLTSILQQDVTTFDPPYEMFIADNGSYDGSREWLEYYAQFGLGNVFFNENIGYSAACNQLASYGSGDIIALLNADVWFTHADLQKIQQIFDRDSSIAILGPKQRDEMGRITHAGIIGTNEAPRHRGWKEYDPQDLAYRDQVDCVTVSGSAYFVRRTAWDTLTQCKVYKEIAPEAEGAFLPTPHFYEETFCSYHARAHNFRVVYDGSVSIGHSWHASSPVGSQNDKFRISQGIFRSACAAHGIPCD